MSRQLPARPNLDHLRKQAKELLESARPQHPDWQLADAQFALARGYGFPSWPAMKTHVYSMNESARLEGRQTDFRAALATETDLSDVPMAGSWVANITASQRHPAMHFQSATLEVAVHGPRVDISQVVVDAAGRPSGGRMTFDADGTPRQPEGVGRDHWLTARWLDAWTLEVVDSVEGREASRGRYEVSRDGRVLTVTAHEQRLVFDKA